MQKAAGGAVGGASASESVGAAGAEQGVCGGGHAGVDQDHEEEG